MEAPQASHQPLVSIVVPAHNEEKPIATCLESVLKDSYPNTQELGNISELDAERKEMVKVIWTSTISIKVSATKPTQR